MESKVKEQELVITREFNAPRDKVWRAWTDAETCKMWYGPKGFTCPTCVIDLRVGGKIHSAMRSPEGQDIWGVGTFKEIIPQKKFVCTDSFSDPHGNVVPASHYGMEGDFPLEMKIILKLEDKAGRTKMTLNHEGIPAGNNQDEARKGWEESFDKLDNVLKQI